MLLTFCWPKPQPGWTPVLNEPWLSEPPKGICLLYIINCLSLSVATVHHRPTTMASSSFFLHNITASSSTVSENTCIRPSEGGGKSRSVRYLSWGRREQLHHQHSEVLRPVEFRRRVSKSGKKGAVPLKAVYTEKQEALVKQSWAILKKDAAQNGLKLFTKVFEIAPSAKKLFSFFSDSISPQEQTQRLKSHALKVFVIICEAAASLHRRGEVSTPGSTMKDMAHAHHISGVVNEHYEVVEYCLLKTLEEGLPADMWNDEMKEAWSQAYEELVRTMRAAETP